MKAKRGMAPTVALKAQPSSWSPISKALLHVGYLGRITNADPSKARAETYALVVPFETALDDLSFHFNRKGWGYVSREEFAAALRKDGVRLTANPTR